MLVLGGTPLNLHKLIKLKHPPLAARVPLATLVEDGHARVVHTRFPLARLALAVLGTALFAPALGPAGDLQAGVVVVGLGRRRRRRGRALCRLDGCSAGGSSVVEGRDLGVERGVILGRLLLLELRA